MNDTQIADAPTRQRALDGAESFAVAAPAGSGKTGLLTRRILRLLAGADYPEQVLAITFTRKAAAEMHQRLTEALVQAQDEEAPANDYDREIWQDARRALARDRAQNWNLLANPARLRIMTIDGLCRFLARQLALDTRLGEIPEPAEQPEHYYRQAIRDQFAELDRPGQVADALARLLAHFDNNLPRLEGLLESLLAKREQWLAPLLGAKDARHLLEDALTGTITETLESAARGLTPVAGELASLVDYAARNLEHLDSGSDLRHCLGLTGLPDNSVDPDTVRQWRAIADLLLKKDGDWRAKVNKTQGFPTAKDSIQPERVDDCKELWQSVIERCRAQPGLLERLEDVRYLPAAAFSDDQWHLLDALTLVLPRLVSRLSLLFREQSACDFTEITIAALTALGEEDAPTDLALKLDYQIQHILVDEFQDTAFLQFQLLKRLVAGWQPGDGRTLFIVGDGMQSLYGFRNANVGLFLEARQQPVDQLTLTPLDLAVNFRSDPLLVNWVNQTFRHVFPAEEDIGRGAVPHTPAVAARGTDDDARLTIDLFEPEASADGQARQIVERIRAARAADPAGSVAILARARSHLTAILPALQEAGIAWEATDIDPLASRMPVIDLLSLTRALLDPADRIAWLAILRAPWCGLGLHDLYRLANAAGEGTDERFPWLPGRALDPTLWRTLSSAGQAAMARCGPVLAAAWDQRLRKPLRAWIEGTWLALGGPATLGDEAQQQWCRQYFDLLEKHAKGPTLPDMKAFEKAVEQLYAAPVRHTDGEPAVQVMTIHKSKGLEFDTVIVPALERGGAGNDSALLYWRERLNRQGRSQLLMAPPGAGGGRDDDPLVRHLKREEKLKSRLEDARVLYVACTRAVKRLHLLFQAPDNKPAASSLLARLWPALTEQLDAPPPGVVIQRHEGLSADSNGTEATPPAPRLRRLAEDWQWPLATAVERHTAESEAAAPSAPEDNRQARHMGTVLHRTLKQIVREGLDNWDNARLARQQQAWRVQLEHLGAGADEDTLAALTRSVTNTLAHPEGRWLLNADHAESACELPLGHTDAEGRPALAVIDRTFVCDGVRWIVDYKHSAPASGQSMTAFIAEETARYREQLQRYARLFQSGSTAVRAALYFPRIPHFAPLD